MIDQQAAADLIRRELPELATLRNASEKNIYRFMRRFLVYTGEKIRAHNYTMAGRCFRLANALYEKGNSVVKNTIENIFVYSFSSFLHMAQKDRDDLIREIPENLYSVYLNQACHKGY